MSMRNLILWIVGAFLGVIVLSWIVWFLFFRVVAAPQATNTALNGGLSDAASTQGTGSVGTNSSMQTNQTTPIGNSASSQRVFKIADGPVSGATFTQTFNPTTTLARYVLQENGHVMDQPIDVPGSLARAVSNTTIPGTETVEWGSGGSSAFMQYQDGGVVKTVSLLFPVATSSKQTQPVQIEFLPDNASGVAVSPNGTQVAYLLHTSSGSDGYVSNIDGGSAKKLFSIGFKELILSWPSTGTLLLSTKSAANTPGMAFSVDIKTGAIVPLLYADSLTATADPSFSNMVYRAESNGTPAAFLHNLAQGRDIRLSFSPIPEKCAWGKAAASTVYCAVPLQYTPANYLDLWHMGLSGVSDSILSFTPSSGLETRAIAVPGSSDGGEQSDAIDLAVSPDDKYLLFIKKGDRSLWGVRLSQ